MKIRGFAPFRHRISFDSYTSLKVLVLAALAVLATQLVWAVVTPVGPFGDWRPAAPRTLSAEAQSALLSTLDPFFRSGAVGAQASAVAQSDLQLFGTRLGSDGIPGSAILGQADGEQRSYVVGEEVSPGVKLAAVHFDRVELDRAGIRQSIAMPGAPPDSPSTGQPATSIADAFDFKPRMSGAAVTGALVKTGPNLVAFRLSGLRQGDVIVAINGARVSSLIDIQQLQASIAPGARLILTVERGSQTLPIPLNLPANQ